MSGVGLYGHPQNPCCLHQNPTTFSSHSSDEKPEALRKAKKGERKDWGCNLVDNVLA